MDGPVPRSRGPLRWLTRLLIRGPDADFVRTELEEAHRRDLQRGVPPRRARRRHLINVLGSAVSLWSARLRGFWFSPSWLDVKLGLRMLAKHPGMTAVSVFALAIGIPVGLAPSWLAGAIEAPLPDPGGERIQAIQYWNVASSEPVGATWYEYLVWKDRLDSFESLAAARPLTYTVARGDDTGALTVGADVTASMFELLRARPLLGRLLLPSDQAIGGPDVAVIGYRLWQARFAGEADVVGEDIIIGGAPYTVVGVVPDALRFPGNSQLWLPLHEREVTEPGGRPSGLFVYGRPADGVSPEEARAELAGVTGGLANRFPEAYARLQVDVLTPARRTSCWRVRPEEASVPWRCSSRCRRSPSRCWASRASTWRFSCSREPQAAQGS